MVKRRQKRRGGPGRPLRSPPDRTKSRFLVQSPRAKIGVALRVVLHDAKFRVPPISLSANHFPSLCPSSNTCASGPETGRGAALPGLRKGTPFRAVNAARSSAAMGVQSRSAHERSRDESECLWIFRTCSHSIWCQGRSAPQVSRFRDVLPSQDEKRALTSAFQSGTVFGGPTSSPSSRRSGSQCGRRASADSRRLCPSPRRSRDNPSPPARRRWPSPPRSQGS